MTATSPNRRLQIIAVVFAGAALAMAAIAVVVVATRSSSSSGAEVETKPEVSKGPIVIESRVDASEIVKLDDSTRGKLWSPSGDGIHVDDAALRKSFGLEPDDVIVAIAGHELHRNDRDLHRAMFDLTMALTSPDIVYIDVSRKSMPVLLRWRVSGDLRVAARELRTSSVPPYGMGSGSGSGSAADPYGPFTLPIPPSLPPPDPLVASIKKIDDTHAEMPASTRDKLLADPLAFMTGARVVPAMKNGHADGFKLYAIRPSSAFAALGFNNGDTVHSINGYDLNAGNSLDAFTKLKTATSAVFNITRRGQDMTITIDVK